MSDATFTDLLLRPRDPILLRDGRPFAAEPGARARTLPWPMPQTVAGALRAHVGETLGGGFDWKTDGPKQARRLHLRGPLLATQDGAGIWRILVPAPRDAVFFESEAGKADLMCLRPLPEIPQGAGTLSPTKGLRPMEITEDRKPRTMPAFWPLDCAANWLSKPQHTHFDPGGADPLPTETRTFVKINEKTQTGEQGMLYSADLLCFADFAAPASAAKPTPTPAQALLCRLSGAGTLSALPQFLPLGGERRLATVAPADDIAWPQADDFPKLTAALAGAKRLRLQLVTPALFQGGWKPGWLTDGLKGDLPGVPGLRLTLVGAAVGRLAPVSGWDLEKNRPKPLRYAAPAGSVYFFEVEGEGGLTPEQAEALFLRPINDKATDDNDGFGLALPGIWETLKETNA